MAQRLQKIGRSLLHEAKQSTDSITTFRFIVLGSDKNLMKEACDIILGSTNRKETTTDGSCELREADVSGRHVSVVQTPAYWMENLKTYISFSDRLRSVKTDLEFSYSLVFPGPHAFLLVLGDVRNSGKEHYLLRALGEVFGQKVLDYCTVLFMQEHRGTDRNRCVRKCGRRSHVLKDNEESVLKLLQDVTSTMAKQRRANFFTKDLVLLDRAEEYFTSECDAMYGERERKLRGDLAEMRTTEENLKMKIAEMEKQKSENLEELQKLRAKLEGHEDREHQLRNELADSISKEIQLNLQTDVLKKKLKENLKELQTLRCLKRRLNEALTTSSETENQLKTDNDRLQREQHTDNEVEEDNQWESNDNPVFLSEKTQSEHNKQQEPKEAQQPVRDQHDSDRRDMKLDNREKELSVILSTGPQHERPIYTVDVNELKSVRPKSMHGDPPKRLKSVRPKSMYGDPPNLTEDKP